MNYLLNGLPYFPGTTIFGALIAPSLTSPAATPLTLGTGSFGTALTVASATGTVSIASTTAASANVGALVIAGGISAGNTGSAASYFGSRVNITSTAGAQLRLDDTTPNGEWIIDSGLSAARFEIYNANRGSADFSILHSTGAATFAGDVSVTGALKLGNAYVGTPVVGTGYIVIQDSNGTNYKVSVAAL